MYSSHQWWIQLDEGGGGGDSQQVRASSSSHVTCGACWDRDHPPVNRITDRCKNITFPQLRLRAMKKRICWNGVIAALRVAAGNAVETGEQWLALNDRETEGCFRWKVPDHLFEYPVVFDNFAGGISTKKCFKWLEVNSVKFSRKG